MKLYSTNNKKQFVTLSEAVMKGLPDDNGLFMPDKIPALPASFIENLDKYSFQEIAYMVAKTLMRRAIPAKELKKIIQTAITFPVPLVSLEDNMHVLELTHGPSLAFKDFGARFMAQLMSYFNRNESKELVILVATSGDTGGAVAAGFYKTPGIKVVILYPSGKVSHLQEQQLTTLGHNITALEINGTFDDCQALVKKAFLDKDLTSQIRLSSANSINIARLIPQSFYYFEGYKQLKNKALPVVFAVPSGNFGNLTAGLLAKNMGLPIHHFIAATNINDVVPEYLASGTYTPRPSKRTLSNAMDVGNPSNFARMLDLYCSTWNNMRADISGYAYDDATTSAAMVEIKEKYGYTIDPHGAVAYLAYNEYQAKNKDTQGIILETAHPAKFLDDVESILKEKLTIPKALAEIADKEKYAIKMEADFGVFKNWLAENF
jgi:threonine synthase